MHDISFVLLFCYIIILQVMSKTEDSIMAIAVILQHMRSTDDALRVLKQFIGKNHFCHVSCFAARCRNYCPLNCTWSGISVSIVLYFFLSSYYLSSQARIFCDGVD